MRGQSWMAAVAALALGAARLAAADVALTYVGPTDGSCPDPTAVEAALRDRAPGQVFAATGTTLVVARITPHHRHYTGSLTIVAPGLPPRTLPIPSGVDCGVVVDGLAQALATDLQSHAAPAIRPRSAPVRRPEPITGHAFLSAGTLVGVLEGMAPTFALGGRDLRSDWSWGGRVGAAFADRDGYLAKDLEVSILACRHAGPGEGCIVGGLGFMNERMGFTELSTRYGVIAARAGLTLALGTRAALLPAVELGGIATNGPGDTTAWDLHVVAEIAFLLYTTGSAPR